MFSAGQSTGINVPMPYGQGMEKSAKLTIEPLAILL